jgi:hypothetical protein
LVLVAGFRRCGAGERERLGARLEREAAVPPSTTAKVKTNALTLSIHSGHVKSVRSDQVRSFEIFVAQASNDPERRPKGRASVGLTRHVFDWFRLSMQL